MADDSYGDTSDSSANSPYIFSLDISFKPTIDRLYSRGYIDADVGEYGKVVTYVGQNHLNKYLAAAKRLRCGSCSVKDARDLIVFDRSFQSVVFKYIGVVEHRLRCLYAHYMSLDCGEFAIYDQSNFLRERNYARALESFNHEVSRKVAQGKSYVGSVARANGGRLPLDVAVDCMTLGMLSRLLSNTRSNYVTGKVAADFGIGKDMLFSWMRTVTDVRNICAHFDAYIIRKSIPSIPMRDASIPFSNSHPFYIVNMLDRLLRDEVHPTDRNVDYGYRIRDDIDRVTSSFRELNGDMLSGLSIPMDWNV